jgi:regulator of cell morphogenesis and NO signaling
VIEVLERTRSEELTMTTVIDPASTLADIVIDHPDLARELERRSLDYCCGGERTLAEACRSVGLDPDEAASELAAVATAPPAAWADLGPAELVDHIEATHHAYLHAELPRLAALADKVLGVHGGGHPELADVHRAFTDLREELEPHLLKEERVLFPLIRGLAATGTTPEPHRGNLGNPISVMLREHDHAGEILRRLRHLTNGYTTPPDGCASYAALYRGLAEVEADTHLHVHKENNRLFPSVLELERRTSAGVDVGAQGPR